MDRRAARTTVVAEREIDLGGKKRTRAAHGTRIEISPPVGKWSRGKVEKVFEDLSRLQSIFVEAPGQPDSSSGAGSAEDLSLAAGARSGDDEFTVFIYRGDTYEPFRSDLRARLDVLLTDHSVFKINGRFDEDAAAFRFDLSGQEKVLTLSDPEIRGLGGIHSVGAHSKNLGAQLRPSGERPLHRSPQSNAVLASVALADVRGGRGPTRDRDEPAAQSARRVSNGSIRP